MHSLFPTLDHSRTVGELVGDKKKARSDPGLPLLALSVFCSYCSRLAFTMMVLPSPTLLLFPVYAFQSN
jgi:hypothetical protein